VVKGRRVGSQPIAVAPPLAFDYALGVTRAMGLPLLAATTERFENGQFSCRVDGPEAAQLASGDVIVFQLFDFAVSDRLLEFCLLCHWLRARAPRSITAVLPYLPYSRSDRQLTVGANVPFALIADLLAMCGVTRVICAELHAQQLAIAFRIPVIEVDAMRILADHLKSRLDERTLVVAPDFGSAKRAERMATALRRELVLMRKRRTSGGVKEVYELCGDVQGRPVLLIDDEVNSGETLLSAARVCRKQGAISVQAAVCHPLFSAQARSRFDAEASLERLYTNDTVYRDESLAPRITEVVSLQPAFASALAHARIER
jgi:ribose-phosphate pyrophosphokinase